MNNIIEKNEPFEKFKLHSKMALDFSKTNLLEFARNLEYKDKEYLKIHQLCKYINSIARAIELALKEYENIKEQNSELIIFYIKQLFWSLEVIVYFNTKLKDYKKDYNHYDNEINILNKKIQNLYKRVE